MRIQVTVHGLLTLAVPEPCGQVELALPDGADVQSAVEVLAERSPLFDPRACMAVIDAIQVPMDHVLRDGDHLHLLLIIGGG